MNEPAHRLFGEHDQEVLFKAFAHFVANTTKKSMNIVIGMLRLCIQEVVESNKMSIPETKKLDENVRRKLLETGIDEFLKRARVGSVHQHEIRKGCLSIYERWHAIRSSIREEATIQIEEILEDPNSSIIGYEDQEVLLAAFAHYITMVTGRDRISVITLIRVCMLEVTIPMRVSFKEARMLDEDTRKGLIVAGIEEYLRRSHIEKQSAETIRADCLRVYNRWKEIRRIDPSREEIGLPELITP